MVFAIVKCALVTNIAVVVVLVGASGAPALGAGAAGKRAERPAVEALLRGPGIPPGARDLAALGIGVDRMLCEIAGDHAIDILLRARAVSSLSFFATPASRAFLEATVKGGAGLSQSPAAAQTGERLLVRRAAVALGWLGGSGVPALLEPLLGSPDPDVRLDTTLGLGLLRSTDAADALKKRLPAEQIDRVRAQMSRQIRVIEDALAAATATQKTQPAR